MSADDVFVISEPTWWCRTTVARRIRELERISAPGVIVAQLSGRKVVIGEAEDRTCDRCRTYVPKGPSFWCAIYAVDRFRFVMGLCTDCARRESPAWVSQGVSA